MSLSADEGTQGSSTSQDMCDSVGFNSPGMCMCVCVCVCLWCCVSVWCAHVCTCVCIRVCVCGVVWCVHVL